MSVNTKNITRSQSFHTNSSSFEMSCSPSRCKSDGTFSIDNFKTPQKSYKQYDLSESVENDDSSNNDHSFSEDSDHGNKDSITNSDLDNLEMEILRKISEKLQTDETSITSIDSNIKVLKTIIQNIFNGFHENMEDFETFKVKFNDTLQKYKGDSPGEMEKFVQNILEHVSSAESNNKRSSSHKVMNKRNLQQEVNTTLRTFNNANFTTATSADCESFNAKTDSGTASLSTFVLSDSVMNKRKLFSEINIREHFVDVLTTQLASSENIKKIAAKKLELENYAQQKDLYPYKDSSKKTIPVKVTSAKKDLYLDKDFITEKNNDDQFFIFKICSYICKKIRKNTFA